MGWKTLRNLKDHPVFTLLFFFCFFSTGRSRDTVVNSHRVTTLPILGSIPVSTVPRNDDFDHHIRLCIVFVSKACYEE